MAPEICRDDLVPVFTVHEHNIMTEYNGFTELRPTNKFLLICVLLIYLPFGYTWLTTTTHTRSFVRGNYTISKNNKIKIAEAANYNFISTR